MSSFLVLVPFVALAGLFQLAYGVRDRRRRWRRLIAGSVLILLLWPAWMLIGDGRIPRRTSVLLLLPAGQAMPPSVGGASPVAAVNLGQDIPGAAPLEVVWSQDIASLTGSPATGSISGDWQRLSACAVMPWSEWLRGPFLPKPVVAVVDGGSNMLDAVRAQDISVSDASEALKARGVTLYRLKSDANGVGGGRLELSVTGNSRARSVQTLSTTVDVSLSGCPFPAAGNYTLRAWLDRPIGRDAVALASFNKGNKERSIGPDKHRHVIVGARDTDRRTTALSLYEFEPSDAVLSPGLHEVSVELAFIGKIDGADVPLTYRASTFFEVVERRLIVFSAPSKETDLMRRSWVHRDMPAAGETPPEAGGAVAKTLIEENNGIKLLQTGNSTRTPFTSVEVVADTSDMTLERLAGAAELMLVEPTWEDLTKLSDVIRSYAGKGGSVLIVRPPVRPKGDATEFDWLPALSDGDKPLVRGDPRIYLLPDASRPASFIGTPSDRSSTGVLLQLKLFNRLAARLDVGSSLGGASTGDVLALPDKQRLSLTAGVRGVLRSARDGGWSIVPPAFMRSSETTAKTSEGYRAAPGIGAGHDLATSWVEARLGLLESAQRQAWYGKDALHQTFTPPPSPAALAGLTSGDLDLPLEQGTQFPGAVIVVAALDVPQAKKRPDKVPVAVWTREAHLQDDTLPNFLSLEELVKGGAEVVIVPIKLGDGFFGAGGPYGAELVKSLESSLGVHGDLVALCAATGAQRTDVLPLDGTDAQIQAVVDQILKRVDASVAARRKLVLNAAAAGRAADLRSATSVPVTFAYHALVVTKAATGIEPAARVELPPASASSATLKHDVLFVMPYDQGVVSAIGFSPLSFDRWYADRAHAQMEGAGDGWGLQRLIDPVVRMPGNIGSGSEVEAVHAAADRSQLRITWRLPVSNTGGQPFELPRLEKGPGGAGPAAAAPAAAPTVTVLGFDPMSGRMELSVAASDANPVNGEYRLTFLPEGTKSEAGTRLFVAVNGQGDPAGAVRERLDRIAYQTGGGVVDVAQFGRALSSATFDRRFVGAGLLVLLTIALLSPLSRAWHSPAALVEPLIRWRNRRRRQADADVDDEAEAYAALDAGGMSRGEPAAQRPAGPVVQLRQMRPGDSAAAVPPNRWILFVPELADAIGSPPLPRVYETPRPQAMSILTLLDLHPGAAVHDSGDATDRLRVMTRIAMMNAIASGRRGGTHRVTALQAREDSDSTEASMPDQVAARVAALRGHIGRAPAVPELLEHELVILISDPASVTRDELMRQLARDCGENLCPLSAVLLVHPNQLTEFGNRTGGAAAGLFDRSDLDSGLLARFHVDRTEQVSAALGIVDSRTVAISSGLSSGAIAKVLAEEAWTHA